MPPAPRRNIQARPGDLTGRNREKLARDNAEELSRRANELGTTLAAEAQQRDNEVVDVTGPQPVVEPVDDVEDYTLEDSDDVVTLVPDTEDVEDEVLSGVVTPAPKPAVVVTEVVAAKPWEIIQVVEELENVTIGAGNLYTFEVGRKYKVTPHVASHLREKGYVY